MNRASLLAGIAGGLLILLLLAPATGSAVGQLQAARHARATAAIAATAPVRPAAPLVRADLRLPGDNAARAGRALATRIRSLAAAGGVLVEQMQMRPSGDGLVRLQVRVSGPDKAVIALADRIEREAPLVRLRDWQVVALAGGALRIEGEAVAAWR